MSIGITVYLCKLPDSSYWVFTISFVVVCPYNKGAQLLVNHQNVMSINNHGVKTWKSKVFYANVF